MAKQFTATSAKNAFGELLDEVASLGQVEIVKHGRVVAVMLAPREIEALRARAGMPLSDSDSWRRNHVIPADLARRARILRSPAALDEDID